MKALEIATCINLYEDAIDCSKFVSLMEEDLKTEWSEIGWLTSSTGPAGLITNYRTSVEADIRNLQNSNSPIGFEFSKIHKEIIDTLLKDYETEYLISTGEQEDWRILRYSGGAEYRAHYDHGPTNSRVISIVAFLQTPESGGQLEFPFFGVSVEAKAGNVLIFPSNFPYVHIAHPVTSGIKCSLVTWLK